MKYTRGRAVIEVNLKRIKNRIRVMLESFYPHGIKRGSPSLYEIFYYNLKDIIRFKLQ